MYLNVFLVLYLSEIKFKMVYLQPVEFKNPLTLKTNPKC